MAVGSGSPLGLLALAALRAAALAAAAEVPWYPYNSTAWATSSSWVCAVGQMQSPIDLPLCEEKDPNRTAIVLAWGTSATVDLVNNGHTVQISPPAGTGGKMQVGPATYTHLQCHWHWGSEHTVGGVQQDMAVHCVHSRDDQPGRYGVLGLFYKVGSAADAFIAAFQDKLPQSSGAAKVTSAFTGPVTWGGIVDGISLTEYWTYNGSFTTPPCTEAVDWYPLMGKKSLTVEQYNLMKLAMGHVGEGGNYRPPQPVLSRDVQGCLVAAWYPYQSSYWAKRVGSGPAAAACLSGHFQSPVNLPDCSGGDVVARPAINVSWGSQTVQLINNGHTVQLNLVNTTGSPAMYTSSGNYSLKQCHFHWGTEHTVGGRQFPLDVHCVHAKGDGSGRYGVLGVMFEVGGSTPHPFLSQFENALPAAARQVETSRRLAAPPTVTSNFTGPVNFDLLWQGLDTSKYWTYPGSLTTPPCSELVDWYPLMARASLTQAQLEKFQAAIGWGAAKGNYRPPQPRSGRTVEGCKFAEWYPYSQALWAEDVQNAEETCAVGNFQSPIDLPPCDSPLSRPAIRASWGSQQVAIKNTGHTVVVTPSGTTGRMATPSGNYTLLQCHFHWPSEHTVNGQTADMVAHCVHSRDDGVGRFGVLAVFYQVKAGVAGDPFLSALVDKLPPQPDHGAPPTVSSFTGPLNLDAIYGSLSLSTYWSYAGSLTTPPCSEVVDWHLLMGAVSITSAQFQTFKAALGTFGGAGNFRPPQPLKGREVLGCGGAKLRTENQASLAQPRLAGYLPLLAAGTACLAAAVMPKP